MTFIDLELSDPILRALNDKGYDTPTPIQQQAIPIILDKKDLLGVAQTGTGKTAAFAIPIIQLLAKSPIKKKGIRALIITPTRELAIQIEENIEAYSKYEQITHTVIFGGVKQHQQVINLKKGIDILVATPGRLLDLMDQGIFTLDTIEMFVLDEADRMLDMGFIHDINRILKVLPKQRQSLFFSATMPENILKLSRQILHQPQKVEVTPAASTAQTVNQVLYYTNKSTKKNLLLDLIRQLNIDQALIFTRTKHGADRLSRDLNKQHIKSSSIHGDKQQSQRQKSLSQFKSGGLQVLVATDLAARGIDIDKLNYVVNFDIPNESETYVHRIGRVGRAGEIGTAISICEPEENEYIKDIEKLIRKKIPVQVNSKFPQTEKPMTKAEKKEWEKEKQRRKQEFFKNRKKNRN